MPRKTYEVTLEAGGDPICVHASSQESLVRHYLRALFSEARVRLVWPRLSTIAPDVLFESHEALFTELDHIRRDSGLSYATAMSTDTLREAFLSLTLDKVSSLANHALGWAVERTEYERAWRWGRGYVPFIKEEVRTNLNPTCWPAMGEIPSDFAELVNAGVEEMLVVQNGLSLQPLAVSAVTKNKDLVLWTHLSRTLGKSPKEVSQWWRFPSNKKDYARKERVWLWRKGQPALDDADVYLNLAGRLQDRYGCVREYSFRGQLSDARIPEIVAQVKAKLAVTGEARGDTVAFVDQDTSTLGTLTFGEFNGQVVPTRLTVVSNTNLGAKLYSVEFVQTLCQNGHQGVWEVCWVDEGFSHDTLLTWARSLRPSRASFTWADDELVRAQALHQTPAAPGTDLQVDGFRMSTPKYDDLYRQWASGVAAVLESAPHPAFRFSDEPHMAAAIFRIATPNIQAVSDNTCLSTFTPPTPPHTTRGGLPKTLPASGTHPYVLLLCAKSNSSAISTSEHRTAEGLVSHIHRHLAKYDPAMPLELAAAQQGVVFWAYHRESPGVHSELDLNEMLTASPALRWETKLKDALKALWYRIPRSRHLIQTEGWNLVVSGDHYRFTKGALTGVMLNGEWSTVPRGATHEDYQQLYNAVQNYTAPSSEAWSDTEAAVFEVRDRTLENTLLGLTKNTVLATQEGLVEVTENAPNDLRRTVRIYNRETRKEGSFTLLGDTLLDASDRTRAWLSEELARVAQPLEQPPGTFDQRIWLTKLRYSHVPSRITGHVAAVPSGESVVALARDGVDWLYLKYTNGLVHGTPLSGPGINYNTVQAVVCLGESSEIRYAYLTKPFDKTLIGTPGQAVSPYVAELASQLRATDDGYLVLTGKAGEGLAFHISFKQTVWYNTITFDLGVHGKLTLRLDVASKVWTTLGATPGGVHLENLVRSAVEAQEAHPEGWLKPLDEALELWNRTKQAAPTPATPAENQEQEGVRLTFGAKDADQFAHTVDAIRKDLHDTLAAAEPPPAATHDQTPSGEGMKDNTMKSTTDDKTAEKIATSTPGDKIKAAAAAAATEAKQNATEAAWRTATKQLVKLTRDPLAAMIQRHLGPDDESMRKKIADFLLTDAGTAMLAGILAVGVTAIPGGNAKTEELARQLRVMAMAEAGDLAADVLMGPLRQVLAAWLQGGVPGEDPAAPPMLGPATPLESQLQGETASMASASLLD